MTRGRAVGLLLLGLAWAFVGLGARPLAVPSEARYAEAARAMVERGDPWTPHYAGRPHLTKPPATYWAIAGGLLVFGENPWGVRAGAGVAFLLWMLSAYGLGRHLRGREDEALFAALCLATAPLAFAGASVATSDVFLSAVSGLALLAAARALTRPGHRRLAIRAFWLLLGIGMFVKGPPALLPLAGLVFAWRARVGTSERGRLLDPAGLGLFVLVGLGWYVYRFAVDPTGYAEVAWRETVERVSSDTLRRNGPVYLPIGMLLVGSLPWIAWLRRPRQSDARSARVAEGETRAVVRLLGGFALVGLVCFTLSSSRMPLYVMPLVITVAVLAAPGLARWWHAGSARRAVVGGLMVLTAAGALAARLGTDALPVYEHEEHLARAVLERRVVENERVYLLQVVPAPGLRFRLGGALDRVALTRSDRLRVHDLDEAQMLWRLARMPEGRLAVGTERAFSRLPDWVVREDPFHEPRSGMMVARLRVR